MSAGLSTSRLYDTAIGDPVTVGLIALRDVAEVADHMREAEVVRAQIDAGPSNAGAVRAFRGAGFVEAGLHPG